MTCITQIANHLTQAGVCLAWAAVPVACHDINLHVSVVFTVAHEFGSPIVDSGLPAA